MSDTPISDSTAHNVAELGMLCRRLERELNDGIDRIKLLIGERDTARMYADQKWKLRVEFHDLFGTDDIEQAVAVVREMKGRIERLEDRIHRAAMAFSRDGSDGQVASGMLAILEEERGKP